MILWHHSQNIPKNYWQGFLLLLPLFHSTPLQGDSEQRGRFYKRKCPETLAFNLLCESFKSPLENPSCKNTYIDHSRDGRNNNADDKLDAASACARMQLQKPFYPSHCLFLSAGLG